MFNQIRCKGTKKIQYTQIYTDFFFSSLRRKEGYFAGSATIFCSKSLGSVATIVIILELFIQFFEFIISLAGEGKKGFGKMAISVGVFVQIILVVLVGGTESEQRLFLNG